MQYEHCTIFFITSLLIALQDDGLVDFTQCIFLFQGFDFNAISTIFFSFVRPMSNQFRQCSSTGLAFGTQLFNSLNVQIGGQLGGSSSSLLVGKVNALTFYPQYYPDQYGTEFLIVTHYVVPGWACNIMF